MTTCAPPWPGRWNPAAELAGDGERAAIGLRLVQAMTTLWYEHGHATEGRRWLQRAIDATSDDAAAPLARLEHWLGVLLLQLGELHASARALEQSLAIWRELGDREQQARELNSLGATHRYLGHLDTARTLLEESVELSREIGSDTRLAAALTNLGQVESVAGDLDRASKALREALELDDNHGDVFGVALDQQSLALVSLRAGRPEQARDLLSSSLDYVVSSGDTEFLANTLELSACITADLGDHLRAARLAGAADAIRQKAGMPIPQTEAAVLEGFLAPARATVSPQAWETELAAGSLLPSSKRSRSCSHQSRHMTCPPDTTSGRRWLSAGLRGRDTRLNHELQASTDGAGNPRDSVTRTLTSRTGLCAA